MNRKSEISRQAGDATIEPLVRCACLDLTATRLGKGDGAREQ